MPVFQTGVAGSTPADGSIATCQASTAQRERRPAQPGGDATTVDHVVPRARGGRNTWLNTVAACGGCNQRKGDRTPAEARMPLRTTPQAPTWAALAAR